MKNKILIYTFNKPTQKPYKIAQKLVNSKNTVAFYLGPLKSLGDCLIENHYGFAIGLGNHRKLKETQVETVFTNLYGGKEIIKLGKKTYHSDFTPSFTKLKVSKRRFSGPCNRAAYFVSNTIHKFNLKTINLFIHFPSDTNINNINSDTINSWTH